MTKHSQLFTVILPPLPIPILLSNVLFWITAILEKIVLDVCIPLLSTTVDDFSLYNTDPEDYIRKDEDTSIIINKVHQRCQHEHTMQMWLYFLEYSCPSHKGSVQDHESE